jgi:hypothetical protein
MLHEIATPACRNKILISRLEKHSGVQARTLQVLATDPLKTGSLSHFSEFPIGHNTKTGDRILDDLRKLGFRSVKRHH